MALARDAGAAGGRLKEDRRPARFSGRAPTHAPPPPARALRARRSKTFTRPPALAGFGTPDVVIAGYHLDQGDGIEAIRTSAVMFRRSSPPPTAARKWRLLGQVAKTALTDEAMKKTYDDAKAAQKPETKIHARYILVVTDAGPAQARTHRFPMQIMQQQCVGLQPHPT